MRKLLRLLPAACLVLSCGAQELPGQSSKPLDFEPQLILTEPTADASATLAKPDAARLEIALLRAQKKALHDEQLVKQGILAKVEAERSALKAVQLRRDLAEAKCQAAKDQLAALPGDASAEAKSVAETACKQAQADLHNEKTACLKAQLDAANLNVWRQQKLLAFGGTTKSAVSRAKDQLAALQRQQSDAAEVAATSSPAR